MPTKLYLLNGEIIKSERVVYDEVKYVDIDLNDSPIVENGQIIPFKGSETEKKRKEEFDIMQKKMAK